MIMQRPRYKNFFGVPLGGIGAGKVELCADGAFRHLTTQNNQDMPLSDVHNPFKPMPSFPVASLETCPEFSPHGLEGCFLAAHVEGVGAVVLKEHEPGLVSTLPTDSIHFSGELPTVDMAFPPQGPVELSLAAWSSLVLNEPAASGYRDSSIPAFSLTLRAVNRGATPCRVAFLFSWANLIGIGGFPNAAAKDFRGNFIAYRETDGIRHLHFGHKQPKMHPRLDGTYTLAIAPGTNADVSHAVWAIDAKHGSKQSLWQDFSVAGQLKNGSDWGGFQAGALCAGRVLAPGETLEIPFVLAWHFPTRTDSRGFGHIYQNACARWFDDSLSVARHVFREADSLRSRTRAWRDRLRASNLPDWLATKLINDIFPLYSNSIYDAAGRFASAEAPSVMNGCMGTMDQRAASHAIYSMAFPALSQAELTLFSEQQIGEEHPARHATHWNTLTSTFDLPLDRHGAILHDVGWDDLDGGAHGHKGWLSPHWPDLSLVYVLQCYEHIAWTGDRDFLASIYPKIQAALTFNARLDQDGDGIAELWGPGCCTFDSEAFHYFGTSAYVASLTLAALKAGAKIARWMDDEAFAQTLDARFALARPEAERKLWNEQLGYYVSWKDESHAASASGERPHELESRNCMVAQLAGTWFARLLDLGELLDPARVASALDQMNAKNIGLAEFCPATEVSDDNSLVSNSWPFYAQAYLIAQLCYVDRADDALAALKKIHTAMTVNDGCPWSSPLVWNGQGNGDREWGAWYMTNPVSWFILPALAGFAYNAMDQAITLRPNIPQSWGRLESLPLFMPHFQLAVNADEDGIDLKLGRLVERDSLEIQTLNLRHQAALTLNGAPLASPHSGEPLNIKMEPGDVLSARYLGRHEAE
jgi:non-lysosomal glucosylceramidase